jgi:octaprenyl-diphosphate synthase
VSEAARAGESASARRLTAPPVLPDILAPVEEDLLLVEKELEKRLGSGTEIIRTIGQYISEGGGKRIRPALLLLCSRLAGYPGELHILFATVFELIHTATLVHDDVIDGSTLRRGRSTINERWGNHLTVLVGDHLYLKAMNSALTANDLRLVKILCDITLEMIEGEIVQSHINGRSDVTEQEYLDVMRRKTALLFSGCAEVSGVLAKLDERRIDDLRMFGLNLGMAYQIVDDLLDFTADAKILGKPVANDLREGRVTLPLIYLLERGESCHKEMVSAVLEDRGFDRVGLGEIVREMEAHDTFGRTASLAGKYCEDARRALLSFPDSPARRSLGDVCDFIAARTF